MARTRSQKEKAQGKPSRERRLENATHAEEVAAHEEELQDPVQAAAVRMTKEQYAKSIKDELAAAKAQWLEVRVHARARRSCMMVH